MTKCLFIFLLLVYPFNLLAEPVGFMQAWQKVLSGSDALAAERANVEGAGHLQNAARDLYLPSISLGANYTRLNKPIEIVPSDVLESMKGNNLAMQFGMSAANLDALFTASLTNKEIVTSSVRAIWPIFTGGRIGAVQKIAQGGKEEAVHLLAMQRQAKFEDLAKIYFAVVLNKQVLATKIEVEQGLKQHLSYAIKLMEQGQIAKVEKLQAEVSFDKSKVDRKKTQRDLEIAEVALTKLIKGTSLAEPTTELFTNVTLHSLAEYKTNTLTQYPGLKVLDAKKKQAEGLIAIEKGKYYPAVYLYGNYNLYEDNTLFSKISPDWELGVGIQIPLISSSGRSGKKKAAYSAVMQINHLKAQAKQDLSVFVEKIYREANQSLEEYSGLESSLALAEENLRLRAEAFSQGLSNSLDVVDAQLFLMSIKTQRLAAAYYFVISLSRLLAVSGEIDTFEQYQLHKGLEVK